MSAFKVRATLTREYEITVDASSEEAAIDLIDDWIADDFDKYQVSARWEFAAGSID